MPETALVQGDDGNLYGTTDYGGAPGNTPGGNNVGNGTIFEMTPDGSLTTLWAFSNTNDRKPDCALLAAGDGNFYGLCAGNGPLGDGLIYKFAPFWATVSAGRPFSYQITATNNPTSFNATGLPTGLSIDTTTGLISGTPTGQGTFAVTISATNASGTGSKFLDLMVTPYPTGPSFISALPSGAAVGSAYSFALQTSGFPVPTFTLATGSLPPGLALSAAGVISGNPLAPGNYSGAIVARNGVDLGAYQSFTITVTASNTQWTQYYLNGASANVTSPASTPQSDGVPNLLKYFLDLDPGTHVAATDPALPKMGVDTTTTPGKTYLTLQFRESSSATGLSHAVQVSSDLQNWSSVTPDITQSLGPDRTTGDPMTEVEFDVTDTPRKFIRLRVTPP